MTDLSSKAFSNRAVHAGEITTQGNFSPVTTSIVPSMSYLYESIDNLDIVFANPQPGFFYSHYTNPTVAAFENVEATWKKVKQPLHSLQA